MLRGVVSLFFVSFNLVIFHLINMIYSINKGLLRIATVFVSFLECLGVLATMRVARICLPLYTDVICRRLYSSS